MYRQRQIKYILCKLTDKEKFILGYAKEQTKENLFYVHELEQEKIIIVVCSDSQEVIIFFFG